MPILHVKKWSFSQVKVPQLDLNPSLSECRVHAQTPQYLEQARPETTCTKGQFVQLSASRKDPLCPGSASAPVGAPPAKLLVSGSGLGSPGPSMSLELQTLTFREFTSTCTGGILCQFASS